LLRQAVYRLVNREAIVKAVLRGVGGTPANSPFSEQSFAYGKSDDYPERSVDEAKKLLEQAGKPDGFSFSYKTDPSPTSQQLGQVIKRTTSNPRGSTSSSSKRSSGRSSKTPPTGTSRPSPSAGAAGSTPI